MINSHDTLDILIVEDDDDARESLSDILELDHHRVLTQASATAAFEMEAGLSSIDVILLDRRLPDGMIEDLLPTFRRLAPDADLIVLTAYADLTASIAALRQGVTDFLIKPINPDALLASLRRIAQRRRIERQLQEERQFAEMVLSTAEAIVLVLDTNGRITRFNRYLAELTGYPLQEVANLDWFDTFIPEEERERVRDIFSHTIKALETRGGLNPILTRSGERKDIRWSNTVFRDPSGKVKGVLSVGLDVTDLVLAQQQVLQTERLATIGQTMTGLAHETRNALQRLRNAVELLEDDLAGNKEALVYIEKISRAGNDLRDLLEEVRSYAAPIHLDRSQSSLQSIWRRAWQSLESCHPRQSASLAELFLDNAEPTANIDPRRMEQVFRNLFENAFDAGVGDVEVTITCELARGRIIVSVEDNGPGMPPAERARAFDAFFTTKPTGTGLGLAIVHRIIDSHGGIIRIDDAEIGSKFVLDLPAE